MKWLPFEDRVDWDGIAIIVHRDNMTNIPTLVKLADTKVLSISRDNNTGSQALLCICKVIYSCCKGTFKVIIAK